MVREVVCTNTRSTSGRRLLYIEMEKGTLVWKHETGAGGMLASPFWIWLDVGQESSRKRLHRSGLLEGDLS